MAEWHKSALFMTAVWSAFLSTLAKRDGKAPVAPTVSLEMPVTRVRLLAMMVIVSIRLCISISLLGVGVYWLLRTTSIQDIILNAAALGFVLDLDELVFVTMLTKTVKTVVRSIEFDVSWSWPRQWCIERRAVLGWFPCFAWVCVAVLVTCIVPELQRNVNMMEELDHFLCQGNVDFVTTTLPGTGSIVVKRSDPYRDTLAGTYDVKSLQDAVWTPDLSDLSMAWLATSDWWFSYSRSLTMSEISSTLGTCWDYDDSGDPFTTLLKVELSLDSWDCRRVTHLCGAVNSSTIRLVCPQSCGCDDPKSSLFLNGGSYGCPQSCREQEQYKVALETLSCSTSAVVGTPDWTEFVRSMDTFQSVFGTSYENITTALLTTGCEAVKYYQALLCEASTVSSGFALWCPVQCGCRVPDGGYYDAPCPPSCESWRFKYEEFLAEQPCEDASVDDFRSGRAGELLDLHVATFDHAFFHSFFEDQWIHAIDHLRLLTNTSGCRDLPLEWCGVPKGLRAVCPVICGFPFDVCARRDASPFPLALPCCGAHHRFLANPKPVRGGERRVVGKG